VLSKIVDTSTFLTIERYVKTAIIDREDHVAIAALLAGIVVFKTSPLVIRRWVAEV